MYHSNTKGRNTYDTQIHASRNKRIQKEIELSGLEPVMYA